MAAAQKHVGRRNIEGLAALYSRIKLLVDKTWADS